MATCKECLHFEVCSGFMPTDLDKDVWHYCKICIPEEIPDIDKRCDSFKDSKSWVEVVRCKDCDYRGNPDTCPMCHEEQIEWDDDGYTECDWVLHDTTQDEGFCECGERGVQE